MANVGTATKAQRRPWGGAAGPWPPPSVALRQPASFLSGRARYGLYSFTKGLGMCYLPLHAQAFLIKVILDQSLNR